MNGRCWVEIRGGALRHNVRLIRSAIPSGVAIMAVVKANAYGHGAVPVAAESLVAGATWLGVANVTEACELRKISGFRKVPIVALSALLPEEYEVAVRQQVVAVASSAAEARAIGKVAVALKREARVHFKIDTGMSRLGCWYEHAGDEIAKTARLPGVKLEGLCSHLACADSDHGYTLRQWDAFSSVAARWPALLRHVANSEGIFSGVPCFGEMVRAGIMLYGSSEDRKMRARLRAPLTWKTRVTVVRRVPARRAISYGATYRLRTPQTLATLCVGYADGYPRLLSNRGEVLVRGRRCAIRGRVTMDQIIVDVSGVPNVRSGETVVLLGKQGDHEITAETLARWAETISYEIFTGIGSRVARVYSDMKAETNGAGRGSIASR
jgi:alanine racemase